MGDYPTLRYDTSLMPATSLILSTYEQPRLLELSLLGFALQEPAPDEIVVADDGSGPATAELIRRLAAELPVKVLHVRQDKDGFRLSRIRNRAVAASSGDYLLFCDGDSIPLPGFIAAHHAAREPGRFLSGRRLQLAREATEALRPEYIRDGRLAGLVAASEWRGLRRAALKDRFYRWTRVKPSPKLLGGNFSLHRADYGRVNGCDEAYRGWGLEDDDLSRRLGLAGVRPKSVVATSHLVHGWHPSPPSVRGKSSKSLNAARYYRPGVLARCLAGLAPRQPEEVRVLVTPRLEGLATIDAGPVEVEVLRYPEGRRFASDAEVRVLWLEGAQRPPRGLEREAHVVEAGTPLSREALLELIRRIA